MLLFTCSWLLTSMLLMIVQVTQQQAGPYASSTAADYPAACGAGMGLIKLGAMRRRRVVVRSGCALRCCGHARFRCCTKRTSPGLSH
jgi:hypothetical protein